MNIKRSHARRMRMRRRVRRKITGTLDKPRLTVNRSNVHIYAQVIDDVKGHTLVSCSSRDDLFTDVEGDKRAMAREVGKKLADKCRENGIATVVFDKNVYKYHGRVKALADGAREGGLQF